MERLAHDRASDVCPAIAALRRRERARCARPGGQSAIHRRMSARTACLLICGVVVSLVASAVSAQRGPAADPLVRENATVKLAEHSYVIPDNSVGLVPNVGIVVGSRATLVIDPGLGRRNGETVLREVAKVSKNTELYVASTHFHAEHTTGIVAFPAAAKYVNSTVQEAEFAQAGEAQIKQFSGLFADGGGAAERRARAEGRHHLRSRLLAGPRRRARAVPRRRPDAYPRRHGNFRGRRQRAVCRRRGDEQLVRGGQPELEHEGLAGRVRRLRGDASERRSSRLMDRWAMAR